MNLVVKNLYRRPPGALVSQTVRYALDSLGCVPNRLPHDF
jgi:hypothetical protein